jgi:hypothetical protein
MLVAWSCIFRRPIFFLKKKKGKAQFFLTKGRSSIKKKNRKLIIGYLKVGTLCHHLVIPFLKEVE